MLNLPLKRCHFLHQENNVNPDAPANPDADATADNKEQTKSRLKQKNVGLLSNSQLNKKLSNITGKFEKKGPKRNRNGK